MNEKYGDWYSEYYPHEMIGSKIRVAGVKMFLDGSGSKDRALSEPYYDEPENYGSLYFTQEELNEYVEKAHQSGFQIAIHAVGDRGIEQALNAYEYVLGDESNLNYRHRIEHLVVLPDDLLGRLVSKGIVASFQFHWFSSDWARWQETEMGPDRVWQLGRYRDLIDSGTPCVASSDYPWDIQNWDGRALEGVYYAVTRQGLVDQLPPTDWQLAQRLSVEETLRLITIDAAYATFQEEYLGSVSTGKFADLVVLSDNPLDVDYESLLDIKILMTIVDGNIVYESTQPWPKQEPQPTPEPEPTPEPTPEPEPTPKPSQSPEPEPTPIPESERPDGIPGFTIKAIIMGLLLSIFLMRAHCH